MAFACKSESVSPWRHVAAALVAQEELAKWRESVEPLFKVTSRSISIQSNFIGVLSRLPAIVVGGYSKNVVTI